MQSFSQLGWRVGPPGCSQDTWAAPGSSPWDPAWPGVSPLPPHLQEEVVTQVSVGADVLGAASLGAGRGAEACPSLGHVCAQPSAGWS